MRFLALCLAAGTLISASPSDAKTLLILQSEEGDYIGQGELRTFQAGDGTFTAMRSGDQGVSVSFSGAESWFLDFAAPADAELQPILYPDAERFNSATVPGLDVGGDGRGCNQVEGAFRVHEIVYGAGSAVDQFAADFVQHCEGDPRKLVGSIRVNATDSIPDLVDDDADGAAEIADVCPGTPDSDQRDSDLDGAGDACDPSLQASFVLLDSEEGDYVGQGQRLHWSAANALLRFERNGDEGVDISIEDLGTGDSWHLDLSGPGDAPLAPGAYEMAERFNGPAIPGLDVGGAGRGCNSVTGRFDVFEAEYAPDGDVLVFSADFEQHCEGGAPALRGSIRYRAAFRAAAGDLDGDGWLDAEDNCSGAPNPPQFDTDGNGRGDGCGLEPAEQKCVNEMNKGAASLSQLRGAAGVACMKYASKGDASKLGTPATAQDCLGNDVGGKFARAASKLEAKEDAVCAAGASFAYSDAVGIADAAALGGEGLMADLFGADLDAALILSATNPDGARCQQEIVKRATGAKNALWKLTVKQKKAILLGKKVPTALSSDDLAAQLTAFLASNPKGAVSKPFTALSRGSGKRCGALPGLVAAFPGCAPVHASALAACAERAVRCRFCQELAAADDLVLDCDAFDDGSSNFSCEDL
jgi:hypothetical protein